MSDREDAEGAQRDERAAREGYACGHESHPFLEGHCRLAGAGLLASGPAAAPPESRPRSQWLTSRSCDAVWAWSQWRDRAGLHRTSSTTGRISSRSLSCVAARGPAVTRPRSAQGERSSTLRWSWSTTSGSIADFIRASPSARSTRRAPGRWRSRSPSAPASRAGPARRRRRRDRDRPDAHPRADLDRALLDDVEVVRVPASRMIVLPSTADSRVANVATLASASSGTSANKVCSSARLRPQVSSGSGLPPQP